MGAHIHGVRNPEFQRFVLNNMDSKGHGFETEGSSFIFAAAFDYGVTRNGWRQAINAWNRDAKTPPNQHIDISMMDTNRDGIVSMDEAKKSNAFERGFDFVRDQHGSWRIDVRITEEDLRHGINRD